jgi:hypothetical protein
MQKSTRERLATLSLVVATFLNPLGFDAVQLSLIKLTGSYSRANLSMYFLALSFFGLYFYLSRSNPFGFVADAMGRMCQRQKKTKPKG